ncbi:MAG: type III-A CRISPR-associated RAMP protein Csm3 [Anaerolineae bacterium]
MTLKLYGRVFIEGEIEAKTGLHIGGSGGAFSIGGVDNPVIIDQLTRQPYIPGSSLRGKMRSLTEKYLGRVTGQKIDKVFIHSCRENKDNYPTCPVCNIYGITAEKFNLPTRLVVRDVPLEPKSAERLQAAKTSLPYTEVKTEVTIDRVTSQANPRDVERVPAGAVFGPMELVYNIYTSQDIDWLGVLLDGMQLLEDDYLGGMGSRGSGKIVFRGLKVTLKQHNNYRQPVGLGEYASLGDFSAALPGIIAQIKSALNLPAGG